MPESKINAIGAYAFQGEVDGSYKGSDFWQQETLKPGTKLVQLIFLGEMRRRTHLQSFLQLMRN